jgi:hypothetical protein
MDKASGVYLTITDNSFITGGTTQMKVIVPMLTNKGEVGITRVTANTFKDLVGYDLKYNSNYYGLQKLLENMSYLDVWRVNQGAKMANAYFVDTASPKASEDDCDSFEDITRMDPAPIFAAAHKYVGDWQKSAVKLAPTPVILQTPNEGATSTASQTLEFEDASERETMTFDSKEVCAGCVFYNSSDNSIVGIIKKNKDGDYNVYKVVDGEIVDDTITYITTNAWTDGTNYYDSAMVGEPQPEGEAGTPVSIGNVRSGTYTATTDAWQINGTSYDKDIHEFTPEGTKGSGTSFGKGYFATVEDTELDEGALYVTPDSGTSFFKVTELAATWDSCVKTPIESGTAAFNALNDIWTNEQTKFKTLTYYPYTEQKDSGFYVQKAGFWFKATGFTPAEIPTVLDAETNADIIASLTAASDVAISYLTFTKIDTFIPNSIGVASWDGSKLTVVLASPISKDSFWNVHTIPETVENWTLSEGKFENEQYLIQKVVDFSTNSASDIYWEKVNFGDIQIFLSGAIPSNWEAVRSWVDLENGSNGDPVISAIDIDTSVLDTCGDNILLMNGLTDIKVVNRIASKCQSVKIHAFVDIPAYSSYIDAEAWKKKVAQGEYIAIAGRPDQTENSDGSKIYIYPSVNYGCIFSAMMRNYGNLCFPPAGPTYGTITADDLIECDYEMYQNELKTNRINWQRVNSLGTMMWEQRTNYALNTDLSYIAPIFIIDDLSDQIVTFERQFNFRYMTRSDLLTQSSGLTSIFDSFVTKGFVFAYEIKMPTYEEAQRAGRTLRVPMKVQISKDAEVIELELEITNSL